MGWDHHFLPYLHHHFLQFLPQILRLLASTWTFFHSYDMTTSNPQQVFISSGMRRMLCQVSHFGTKNSIKKKNKNEINLNSVGEYGLSIASRIVSGNLGLVRLPRILVHALPARLNWAYSDGLYHTDIKIETVLFNRLCGFWFSYAQQ